MSEEEQIESTREDGKSQSQKDVVNENLSQQQIIESAQITDHTSNITTSDIPKMEVHHHPHVEKKNFREYLLEGLMIFVAVTLGFFAENQREHLVEHQREKEYMTTLIEDLSIDTADMSKLDRTLKEVMARRDSVDKYLRPPIIPERIPQYYWEAWIVTNITSYNYNDRTVEQLRSSGSYRLIRNKNITDSLIAYDIRMRGGFSKNYNVLFDNQLKIIDLQNDIIDVGIVETYFDDNGQPVIDSLKKRNLWPLKLLTNDTKTLFRHYNTCITHIGFMANLRNWIKIMTRRATNLILMVRKEYHLNE